MRKWLGIALAGLVALAWTGTARATNYALCTGLNKYKTSYVDSSSFLNGCVPDAKNVYTNITLRGEWQSANATLFTNDQGTFAAVSNKLMSLASTAVSGDVVLYYHSSHGYQDSGKNTGICMYDKDMPDSSFAKILANFKAGVKVVIVLDTCHSGGMFKSLRRDGTTRALDTASPFSFAQRVNEELAAIRADEAARGIRTAAKLKVEECGWITAADYNQYSWDGDVGGAFTDCFVGSVKSGACDKSPYGNGDSYATFMEMFDYAVAQDETHGNGNPGSEDYTMPQCTNTPILKAVTFGWVGKEEPSGIRFAPIPEQTATVGAPVSCTLVASNVDGSTGAITFSVASSTAPAGSYSLNGADFTFTAPADGSYSFDFLATNKTAKTFGKASMNVSATLAAPAGLDNSGITATSFTANWDTTPGAASYLLDVASEAFGAKAADDALLSEDFSAFTGTSADRSGNLDEYLAGTGWEGSKVFENDGSAKLGSSKATGWISTPALDLSAGGTVSFLLSQYGSDANTVLVSIVSGSDETDIGSATPGAAETVEFAIPAATAATSVKIATSTKRAIIDDLVVTSGGGADVLANQPVEGTSYTVEGLETSTYYWRLRAVGNAKGPFSATEEVTLKSDPSAPPSIRKIDDIEIEVGETATAQVKVSAPDEAPVTSLSITSGDAAATLEDGVFSFAPAAPGTYDFTITAVNANGPAEVSFAVVATLAEPETPETPAVVASDSFTAVWEAVPGAASYELDVIQGATSGGGGGSGGSGETILTEDFSKVTTSNSTAISSFDDYTQIPGWSGSTVYPNLGMVKLGSSKAAGSLQTPVLTVTGSVTVEWSAFGWSGDATTINVGVSEDGGSTFTETSVALTESMAVYTETFPVSGSSAIVRWQSSAASKQRFYLDDISISSGSKARDLDGNHVEGFPKNVGNVTSFGVTGLQPQTEYTFAFRAVAESGEATDWSAPVSVKTTEGPAAPAWSAIPAQTASIGYEFNLDLSAYVTGSPTPALSLTAGEATLSGTVLSFTPAEGGEYAFAVNAHNDSGDAEATFTVTAVDHVPTKYAVCVGINEYDMITSLAGCVNDSKYMEQNLIERGGWAAENVVLLNDKHATKAAIRAAIKAVADKAVAGDTFVYQHSSHGGQFNATDDDEDPLTGEEGKATFLCVYDEDYYDNTTAYNDYEIAADLQAFPTGVKVVVIVDACHSGGLFKSKEAARAAAKSFDLAGRVTAIMEADRAARKARGENVAKALAPSEIGWATAAEYYESSLDGGFFHTDEWMTNNIYGDEYWVGSDDDGYYNYPSSYKQGGVFTTSATWGWWHGDADTDAEAGDNDGFCDVYEFWKKGYDFCSVVGEFWWDDASANFFPQCTNVAVLKSVELGWIVDPRIPAPEDPEAPASEVTATSFTAEWKPVEGAVSYNLYVQKRVDAKADGETLFSEDFAKFTAGSSQDIADKLDTYTAAPGWTGYKVYSDSGRAKLGTGSYLGWIATPALDIPAGAILSFDAAQYNDKESGTISVNVSTDGGTTWTAASEPFTLTLGGDTFEVAFDKDLEGASLQFIASAKRFYLDNVVLSGNPGTWVDVPGYSPANVAGTSKVVDGLEMGTEYRFSVTALDTEGVESLPSERVNVTTAEEDSAPVWSEIPEQSAVAGELFAIDLAAFVSGSPAPVITVNGEELPGGLFRFVPEAEGTQTFALVASNDLGSADATLTVAIAGAAVLVPTLTLSNATDSTFDADWTACTGAETYQFQVATAPEFKALRAGDAILSEDFAKCDASDTNGSDISSKLDNYTTVSGWTGVKVFEAAGRVKLGSGSAVGNIVTPAVDIPAGATLSFKIAKYGSDTGTVDVQLSSNGGEFASLLDAAIAPVADGETYTVDFAEAAASAKIKFVTSAKRAYVDDVVISGEGGGGGSGSALLIDETVTGLSYTVTGLDPETTYYARVKGGADWSDVQSIATLAGDPSAPAKYALCVGVNEYDFKAYEAMGYELTPLRGTVNDATTMRDNLVARGGWTQANATLLTDEAATEDAVRSAMAGFAARAKAGDTFVYQHSSHGLGPESEDDTDADIALGLYDNLYSAEDFAEDLAAFPAGAKVVVLIDACHSAGMFKHGSRTATRSAAFDIAVRVSAIMDARRAARRARGEDVSRSLSSEEIGWVTAADIYESSRDGGFYDTEEWMEDDDAEGEVTGGYFLTSFTWGWWTGKADVSGTGDGDGWFDAYEGWSYSLPVCEEGGHHPQFLHEDVLRSVELGWIGDAAPSAAITFDPVPGATVGIGEEALLEGIAARNADGTSDGIVLSVVAAPEGAEYTFENGTLAFTPDEDGLFLFTIQAANADAGTTATKLLGVTAVLPAPVALDATDLADTSFTANWQAVDAPLFAYQLQVSTDPAFPAPEPEMVLDEGFDGVTNKASLEDKAWTFTGTFGTYTSSAYCGEDAPSIKFSSGTSVLTSPNFRLSGEAAIRFWSRGNGSNVTSTLKVELLVDGEWTELDTFVPSPDGEQKEYDAIDVAAKQLRFTCTKNVGNVALDDVQLLCLPADAAMALDTDEIDPAATSYPVEDLVPGTTYYYRLRAIANTRSEWSETIEVTTTGEAPLPVPEVGLYAPLSDADTSIGAIMLGADGLQVRVQVATDATFADPVHDETTTASFLLVTGLAPETTYYVRACVIDGDRAGDWSNVESITTASSGPVPPPSEAAITGMTIADGQMTITFAGEGAQVLFSTDLVDWTPVEGATSPYTFDMGDGPGYIGVR